MRFYTIYLKLNLIVTNDAGLHPHHQLLNGGLSLRLRLILWKIPVSEPFFVKS